MHRKDTAIETGNVGANAAQFLAEKELYDMVLVNIVAGIPQGNAFDLTESAPIEGHHAHLNGMHRYVESTASDIIIITGIPRKTGLRRDAPISTNAGRMPSVTLATAKLSPDAVLFVGRNPLDVSGKSRSGKIGCSPPGIDRYVEKACAKLKNRRKAEAPEVTCGPKRRLIVQRRLSVECAKPGLSTGL